MMRHFETLLAEHARRDMNAVAVVDGAERITYGELERQSNDLARVLREGGVRAQDRVCLLLPKSIRAIVAIVAVLKCGGIYVPLDVRGPILRTEKMLRLCRPCWVVADPDVTDGLPVVADAFCSREVLGILRYGEEKMTQTGPCVECVAGRSRHPARSIDGMGGLAYLIFTSGSTGEPKGVPITRESVVHFISWAHRVFGFTATARVSGTCPLHFDLSVLEVFGALGAGAQLHLVPSRARLTPGLTAEFIRESSLTHWVSSPAVLISWVGKDVVRQGDFRTLRRMIFCGDVLPADPLRHIMRRLPHVRFTNLYGPSETTVASSFHHVASPLGPGSGPIPIGQPIPGERLAVLRGDRTWASVDEVGDLYVGGVGLSPGYWRDPERTAAAFGPLAHDEATRWYRTGDRARVDDGGVFHFHGRTDRQVKVRGHRVELDEVAAALSGLPGMADCAVVAIAVGGFEGKRICAAYAEGGRCAVDVRSIRASLTRKLPGYMIPLVWSGMPELPKNRSGKVDNHALEKLFLENLKAL